MSGDVVADTDRTDPSADLVPGWLRRIAALGWRILAALALGLVLIGIAVLLSTVTAAIVVGLIVASTFAPSVKALRARGWDRTRAAAAVSGLALLGIVAALVVIVLTFVPYVGELLAAIREGVTDVQGWLTSIGVIP